MVTWYQGQTLEQNEKAIIKESLRLNGGNKTATALALGIAIRTLQNKVLEIEAEEKANTDAEAARAENDRMWLKRQKGISYDNEGRAILPAPESVAAQVVVPEEPTQIEAPSGRARRARHA